MDIQGISLGALILGALIWFIKGLIMDMKGQIKTLETEVGKNRTSIEVLKSDHSNLEKKLDDIGKDIREIFNYIRNINHKTNE